MVPVTDAPRLLSLYIRLMYMGSVAIGILTPCAHYAASHMRQAVKKLARACMLPYALG
jgi:hypothetical protein